MVKLYLKEDGLRRRYDNSPALMAKAKKGIKRKTGKKHDVKFSLLSGILNIHILFKNVIFVKLGENA